MTFLNNLNGLNAIIPPPQPMDNSEADTLLSSQPPVFPELDLWTHLAFEGADADDVQDLDRRKSHPDDRLEEDEVPSPTHSHEHEVVSGNPHTFDINGFLAGFGIDALLASQLPPNVLQDPQIQPSLAQLLALHASSTTMNPQQSQPAPPYSNPLGDASLYASPAKRSRTRKASISLSTTTTDDPPESPNSTVPLSPAEDKRRRNTAASARFRMKKKEREAALEKRAKELEGRVGELERECEGLKRENGWLKGLVVGVTGANAGSQASAQVKTGGKRARGDDAED